MQEISVEKGYFMGLNKKLWGKIKSKVVTLAFQPILWTQFRYQNFFDIHSWGIKKFLRTELDNVSYAGSKMLDVGAGRKPHRGFFESKGFIYNSCDIQENELEHHSFLADARQIPVSDASYELITSFQVFEHLAEPWLALEEWFRILKKEGTLILTTNFVYPNHGEPIDYFRFTREGLMNLLKNYGFRDIKVIKLGSSISLLLIFIYYSLQSQTKLILKKYSTLSKTRKTMTAPFFVIFALILMPIVNTLIIIGTCPLLLLDRKIKSTKSYICVAAICQK